MADEQAARDWAESLGSTIEVVSIVPVTRVGAEGFSVAYTARTPDGGFEDVGDVAGLDRVRDGEIQTLIMREGLLTGGRIERASASGTRPGLELRPFIVGTVRFEGVVRDAATGKLSLRDPKLVVVRGDKAAAEADTTQAIEELYLRQRVG